MFIDTHAHIYLNEFADDREDMLGRAADAGVGRIYMPNVDHTSIDGMMELESRNPGYCYAMMGLHPCYVRKDFERELYLVEDWLAKRPFTAVGEIGTDLYWDKTFWEQQKEAFTVQLSWAKKYGLPVVIHCRESIDETIAIVESMHGPGLRGVFHCFTGTPEQAERIVKLGFFLGIGGVATFRNGGLDKVLPGTGVEHLILETDSPYLAPVPHRGKRNEPAYIALVAAKVSALTNRTVEEIAEITTRNALGLFTKNESPSPDKEAPDQTSRIR